MWTVGHAGDDGPDEELLRRMSPPENEIPVALPIGVVLGRTDDVALALVGLQVYTTGLSLELAGRMRPTAADRYELNEALWGPHRPRSGPAFLFGVEFADGRRASGLGRPRPTDGIVFHPGGGSGGETSVDQSWC